METKKKRSRAEYNRLVDKSSLLNYQRKQNKLTNGRKYLSPAERRKICDRYGGVDDVTWMGCAVAAAAADKQADSWYREAQIWPSPSCAKQTHHFTSPAISFPNLLIFALSALSKLRVAGCLKASIILFQLFIVVNRKAVFKFKLNLSFFFVWHNFYWSHCWVLWVNHPNNYQKIRITQRIS